MSEAVIVEELTQTGVPSSEPADADVLDAFIGCGSSGDHHERSTHDPREELSAAQLRDSS